jgi:polysaccharide export outer membrane protein
LGSIYEVDASKDELYKVGINDQIEIIVVGHKDLSVRVTVAIDGTIAFPHLGTIYIKDKTLPQIEEEIREKLSDGYVKFPVVSVSLALAMSKRIFVHGEVARNGMLPFEKDMTIIQALSVAGGIKNEGLYGKIKLRRMQTDGKYKKIVEAGINDGIIADSKIEDMLLQPDDILFVERSETFFIQGQVAKTGQFILEGGITVSRALTIAGGIGENGMHGKVKIRRKKEGSTGYLDVKEAKLDDGIIKDSEIEDMLLQPDDILFIERSETFFIQGEVVKAGQYILESGMTVSRALTIAGGIGKDGLHGKVKIRRKREGSTGYLDIKEAKLDNGIIKDSEIEDMLLQPDDIFSIERNESFFIEGEIALPARYILEYGMTVGRAITVAGGIKEGGIYGKVKVRRKREGYSGYQDIEIDIEGIIEGRETGGMILQPDDILIVERNKTYIVYGEVNRIGEFPLSNDTTVFKAILQAGGFNKWGKESRVKVLRLTDNGQGFASIKVNINDVLDGNAAADIFLQPGDVVVVSSGIF